MKLNKKDMISKSKKLIAVSNMNLTMGEYKILDIYLSKINPLALKKIDKKYASLLTTITDENEIMNLLEKKKYDEIQASTIQFTLKEYCRVMELDERYIRREQLEKYTSHLLTNQIKVKDKKGYRQVNLFSSVKFDGTDFFLQSNYHEEEVQKLFFDKGNFEYIKYTLSNTIKLNSAYSIRMFVYLKENAFRKTWCIDLKELKSKVLDCDTEYFEAYKWFNKEILKKINQEINEQTDIQYEYEGVKKGRKFDKIKFTIISNKGSDVIDVEYNEVKEDSYYEKTYKLLKLINAGCQTEEIINKCKDFSFVQLEEENQKERKIYIYLKMNVLKIFKNNEITNKIAYLNKVIENNLLSDVKVVKSDDYKQIVQEWATYDLKPLTDKEEQERLKMLLETKEKLNWLRDNG